MFCSPCRIGDDRAIGPACLQDQALLAAATPLLSRGEGSTGCVLKDLTDTLVGLGRALNVLLGTNLILDLSGLLLGDGSLRGLVEFLNGLLVVSKILLTSNEDDREALAEMQDLGDPLLLDVVKRVGRVDSETDQDDMRVRVGKRAQSVVIFLASGIPQGELDVLAIDFDIGDIVLEDGGNVDLREGTLGEDDEKTGLSTCTITNDNELATDFRHCADRSGMSL